MGSYYDGVLHRKIIVIVFILVCHKQWNYADVDREGLPEFEKCFIKNKEGF